MAVNLTVEQLKMKELISKTDSQQLYPFPSTRFQGSKYKITNWIWENVKDLEFNTVLDAFGGTGSVSHLFKNKGKQVTYNDILKFNFTIGKALIENNHEQLSKEEVDFIITKHNQLNYPTFIQDTFHNVFYLDEENQWLDYVVTNIKKLDNEYKQAIAWFALFQACIIKRPYNLFHRANLYVRTADVKRGFGNKTTWDKPFEEHFINFVKEANKAVFSNGTSCKSISYNALDVPNVEKYDLVYIDTPYISAKGVGTDYLDFYHFLEGMLDYDQWKERILEKYKHLPIEGRGTNEWTKKNKIYNAFDELFNKYSNSTLVVSYRSDGIPSEKEIIELLKKYKNNVIEVHSKDYQYALAHKKSSEILFIAK